MNKVNNEHNREGKANAAIVHEAMEALKGHIPLEYETEPTRGHAYDQVAKLNVYGREIILYVETKKRLTKTDALLATILKVNGEKGQKNTVVLATEYAPIEVAKILQKGGIQFVDTVGNAYINNPPLFIYVMGNKPKRQKTPPLAGRLFKGVGLKIVFMLLCRPNLVGRPYRDLARMTDVALGTVNGTMAELVRKGYILDMGKLGKKLLDRKTLFERWVTAYPDNLKPKLLLGRFRVAPDWWKEVYLDPVTAQWGGEVAAAKLTGYLKPGTITLYAARERLDDLVLTNRLKKDPQGNVEILERFWDPANGIGEGETVHPILVYADLVAVGEQRTMETARMIYEQHIDRYFGED
jgi:hypothetical protein